VKSQGVTFDPKEHRYYRNKTDSNGNARLEMHGVTSLLKGAGISPLYMNNEALARFGSIGHQILRLRLRDDLAEWDPAFDPWMKGIENFVKDCGPFEIICLDDTPVYSVRFGYAGTPDFIGAAHIKQMGYRSALYVLDWKFWKTATREKVDDADIQTSAYAMAAREMGLINRPPKRAVVHFQPGEYAIEPLGDPSAWPTFLSAINIRRWKERHP
jgi:hypothetical protein